MEANEYLLRSTTAPGPTKDDESNIFSSNSDVILRFCCIFFIGIISLWANSAASRHFEITIINDIKDLQAANRFTIFYISNDKATRILQNTTSFVHKVLYPNNKKLDHVTLRFTTAASTAAKLVTVKTHRNFEFVITASPLQIMGDPRKLEYEVTSMILEGTAQIWLWDGGEARPPPWLIDGLVEYIKRLGGYGDFDGWQFGHFCLGDLDPSSVVVFLERCQKIREGFIQRLNQGFKDGWSDRTVEDALGMPVQVLCHSFTNSSNGFSSS